jgi:hypothetical protein
MRIILKAQESYSDSITELQISNPLPLPNLLIESGEKNPFAQTPF